MLSDEKYQELTAEPDEVVLTASLSSPQAFEIIVSRYQVAFCRKARRILGNRPEVDDVVVDTFAKIYFRAQSFEGERSGAFRSWGYRILTNTALSCYRTLKCSGRLSAQSVFDERLYETPDPKDEYEVHGLADYVASVLRRLPEHFSRVLSYYFIDGRPQREIARLEGISVSAVKTRLLRARREFRRVAETIG